MSDLRKFIDLTEGFQEAKNPRNRFAKGKRKLTVGIPNSAYEEMSKWMHKYEDINVTPEELKENPKVALFIERSLDYFFGDAFSEGWENMDLGEELGYEAEDDDNFPSDDEDYGEMVPTPGDPEWDNE